MLSGAPLTYTLCVTNTGNTILHATITDTLPTHIISGTAASGSAVLPGGTLTWRPVITSDGTWTQTVIVTVETGYAGPLTNMVQATTAEGATGVHTATTLVLEPPGCTPIAEVAFVPTMTAQFSPTTFTPIITPGDATQPITYTWDFGDGTPPIADPSPTHTYECGPDTVILTTTNACSQRVISQTVDVLVLPCCVPPRVGFTYTHPPLAGVPVTFTNVTTWCTAYPITYTWNFGDDTLPVVTIHPTHIYTAPGHFTVWLTASVDCGCEWVSGAYSETLIVGTRRYYIYLPLVLKH